MVFEFHKITDGLREEELGSSSLGTTKKGIGPCYSSKMSRGGLRLCDLNDQSRFEEVLRRNVTNKQKRYGQFDYDADAEIATYRKYAQELGPMIVDTVDVIHTALENGEDILVEGANAAMLDVDFGTYPYVTSSNASVGGVCTGLGIPPQDIASVVGVVKAYTTRVGLGPFPTELMDDNGKHLGSVGHEFGTTTGRARRCGWLDLVIVQYANRINGVTDLNLTKLDVLTGLPELKICSAYRLDGKEIRVVPASLVDYSRAEPIYEIMPGWSEDISHVDSWDELPANAKAYVLKIEAILGRPVKWIGLGPGRSNTIIKPAKTV
jgi:adenylosuccinate synthase